MKGASTKRHITDRRDVEQELLNSVQDLFHEPCSDPGPNKRLHRHFNAGDLEEITNQKKRCRGAVATRKSRLGG